MPARVIPMLSLAALGAALTAYGIVAGCALDLTGYRCDDAHACISGELCVDGRCFAPTTGGEGEGAAGEGEGAAGEGEGAAGEGEGAAGEGEGAEGEGAAGEGEGEGEGEGAAGEGEGGEGEGAAGEGEGEGPAFTSWGTSQPDHSVANADCLELTIRNFIGLLHPGDWDDLACDTSSATSYVCDAGASSTPPGGCTSAVVVGKTRFFCPVAADFAFAKASCEAVGAELARVDSDAENNALVTEAVSLTGSSTKFMWLGGSDAVVEGTWKWPDGTVFFVE